MKDCIFCKIASGEIPSETVYEDDEIMVFKDIHPQAPVHLLIIPRRHIASIMDIKDTGFAGRMIGVANRMAVASGIAARGFRLVINSGPEGGQLVGHLHWHLLGGRQLSGSLG